MADVHVDCVVVHAGWPDRLGSGVGAAREVSPQSDPCIARIVERVRQRGRLLPPGPSAAGPRSGRFSQSPVGEAPLPLETWWPGTTAPSRREPPLPGPQQ